MPSVRRPGLRRLLLLVGLLLAGQGLLVVLGVLDHEAPRPVAAGLVVVGAALLGFAGAGAAPAEAAPVGGGARAAVAGLGALASGGVLAYNAFAGSGLGLPEWGILGYGLALLGAVPFLDRVVARVPVAKAVGYSLPLVAAPLSLYAVEAAIESQFAAAPLSGYIRFGLVAPMAWLLSAFGADASVLGETVRIATARGPLFLTVGVVCAGLYAMVVFGGIFALFAWERRTPPARLAAYLALGLAGLHAANVVRLVLLGIVGAAWGGAALQDFHRHAGWVLFVAFSAAYWWLVLRRFEGGASARGA